MDRRCTLYVVRGARYLRVIGRPGDNVRQPIELAEAQCKDLCAPWGGCTMACSGAVQQAGVCTAPPKPLCVAWNEHLSANAAMCESDVQCMPTHGETLSDCNCNFMPLQRATIVRTELAACDEPSPSLRTSWHVWPCPWCSRTSGSKDVLTPRRCIAAMKPSFRIGGAT